MTNDELIEKREYGECLCDGCERRFICWTTKRVFSEPTYQAMYEAFIAEGMTHEDALSQTKSIIEDAITQVKNPTWDEWMQTNFKRQKSWKFPYNSCWKIEPLEDVKNKVDEMQHYFKERWKNGKSIKG